MLHFLEMERGGTWRRFSTVGATTLLLLLFALPAAADAPDWSIVASPNPGSLVDELSGVSCAGPSSCVAVGFQGSGPLNNQTGGTLVESWDGTSWEIMPSPNPSGATNSVLNAVSCTNADNCIAVGNSESPDETLVEAWNGTSWSIVPSPNPTGTGTGLDSVSCTGPDNCVAVGTFRPGGDRAIQETLVESWNGTSWSIVPSPDPQPNFNGFNALIAVSCTAATSCMAVGYVGTVPQEILALSWDGTSWSVLPTPDPGSRYNYLNSVSCIDTNDCTAVGSLGNTGSQGQTLVESWNGSTWSVVPSPSPGVTSSYLDAVSCVDSLSGCVAVGVASTGSADQTLVESDIGGAWTVGSSANQGSGVNNDLEALSCIDASTCVAAGHYVSGDVNNGSQPSNSTLIETNAAGPPANTPEVAFAPLIPVAAIGIMGGGVAYRRRRQTLKSFDTLFEARSV